ncbi:MAG: hypothetical protein Q4C91_19410 [Eubacteriales bacterium]|nr:hypothetical protein [Eubacteriales bacterium]
MVNAEQQDNAEPQDNVESDITGTYVCEELPASIIIREAENGQYEIEGHASWGFNTGDIAGELEQINSQQFLYVENPDTESRAELKIVAYEDRLFVQTTQGMFGGLNVRFDGTYEKQ